MQKNFNNQKMNLTENDIDQIVELLSYKCRIKTINKLRSMLTYCPSAIPRYGIVERLIKENEKWSYCAGQSYPDEIRTVRNIILNLNY